MGWDPSFPIDVLISSALGIQYSSDPNKDNVKFLPEFEVSVKITWIEESLPIIKQTRQLFLNGYF